MDISILWCRSLTSGREFPIAQFSADTDMATDGWASLTSVKRPEVIVTMGQPEESGGDAPALQRLESRINEALHRTDLRAAALVRVQDTPSTPMSFQEFRKVYRRPTLFFRDIFGGDGEAAVVREVTLEEFQKAGGVYAVLKSV